jgi:large subunit ribosomal protein L7/L12
MFVPVPILIAVAAAFLVLLLFALRRRGDSRDLSAPPPRAAPQPRAWPAGAAPIGDLPPDLAAEVRALLDQDRKIEAIKLVRQATSLGLAEAKDMVERM